MNKKKLAGELVKIAGKLLIAIEFPTQKALKEYLKKHPNADKKNHSVVDNEKKKNIKQDKDERREDNKQKERERDIQHGFKSKKQRIKNVEKDAQHLLKIIDKSDPEEYIIPKDKGKEALKDYTDEDIEAEAKNIRNLINDVNEKNNAWREKRKNPKDRNKELDEQYETLNAISNAFDNEMDSRGITERKRQEHLKKYPPKTEEQKAEDEKRNKHYNEMNAVNHKHRDSIGIVEKQKNEIRNTLKEIVEPHYGNTKDHDEQSLIKESLHRAVASSNSPYEFNRVSPKQINDSYTAYINYYKDKSDVNNKYGVEDNHGKLLKAISTAKENFNNYTVEKDKLDGKYKEKFDKIDKENLGTTSKTIIDSSLSQNDTDEFVDNLINSAKKNPDKDAVNKHIDSTIEAIKTTNDYLNEEYDVLSSVGLNFEERRRINRLSGAIEKLTKAKNT